MVWCLLVMPNYCMVDPLAKVNKTAKAIQIPLHSTPSQTCRDMGTSHVHWTLLSSGLFWLFREETLDVDLFLLTAFELLWLLCVTQGLLNMLQVLCNSFSGIKIFSVKISPSLISDDSGCYLLCAPIRHIMFLCPLLFPAIKHYHGAAG